AWDPSQAGPGGPRRDDRPGRRGDRRDFRPEPLIPVEVALTPDPAGVQSLTRQIRLSGRAYPLFEVAGLVIQKPDRYDVTLKVQKDKDGQPAQPLFVCSLDDTVWLSEADTTRHVLAKHFETFYQTERIAADPPKGTYTFVAQCGISGEVLGPPNYHGYQDKLRKLHAERFSRMPFDVYKLRVKIVKDEAVVKQWVENQSFKSEYTTLNVPEPQKLGSREEVDRHFREVHLPNLVRSVESYRLPREALATLPGPLQTLVRVHLDKERRFPLRIATALSGAFAQAGLHFFKRDKNIVHVAVARPHYLDLATQVVSDGVKGVIQYLTEHPKTTRKQLLEALAPIPQVAAVPAPAPAEGSAEAPPAPAPAPAPSTPERDALLTDLHWLVHQGHVIEFANGVLELARKPAPRPEGAPAQGGGPEGGKPGAEGANRPAREKKPRGERTPWSRKRGLFPVASPAVQPYAPVAQLVGV
ncbi:MAG: hypothetical protein ACKO3N_11975, partial [Verrucomicrobiota bacterium]